MKARTFLCALVAATMIFASCGKDNTTKEAAANTMVLDGKTYKLDCSYMIDANGRSYADGQTVDKNDNGDPLFTIIADVEENTLNKTYDLANLPTDGEEIIYFNIHDANWDFQIGPDFTSGTLTISRTEELFTYKATGISLDGKAVSFHISVPKAQWESHL